jgi:hypothetical protein
METLQNPVRIELVEMFLLKINDLEKASTGSARTVGVMQTFLMYYLIMFLQGKPEQENFSY